MSWEIDLLLFIAAIVAAFVILQVHDMLAAAATMLAYSFIMALLFAGLGAVDVAFIEAVLGGVVGVLLIVVVRRTGRRTLAEARGRYRWTALGVVALFCALMVYASVDLPDRGDPEAPAHTHVAPDYIERSLEETRTPNIVTAVLADYRSLDTLGETLVIVTAGLACLLVLRSRGEDE